MAKGPYACPQKNHQAQWMMQESVDAQYIKALRMLTKRHWMHHMLLHTGKSSEGLTLCPEAFECGLSHECRSVTRLLQELGLSHDCCMQQAWQVGAAAPAQMI